MNVPFRLSLHPIVVLDVLVLDAELHVVIAALARHEPGERVLELIGVVDARLRDVALLVDERLELQRRLQAAWSRPLPLKPGFANATFSCVKATRSVFSRVLPSTEFSVPDDRLIDVVFLARRVERHGLPAAMRDDLVALRRRLAQPAHAPGVVRVELLVEADDGVPDAVSVAGAALNSGRAGMLMSSPSSISTRSRLKKKCALSRTTGPPIVPPNCCCLVSGFGRLFFFAK